MYSSEFHANTGRLSGSSQGNFVFRSPLFLSKVPVDGMSFLKVSSPYVHLHSPPQIAQGKKSTHFHSWAISIVYGKMRNLVDAQQIVVE